MRPNPFNGVKSILILFFSLISIGIPRLLFGASSNEDLVYSIEDLIPYEGALIRTIKIHNLERTSERAVKLLLLCREGDTFSADRWIEGLKKVYNTSVLYEARTEIREVARASPRQIDIHLYLTDKWTLVPNINIQGGGGADLFTLGAYDNNFGGYFTNLSFYAGTYNGLWTYDLNQFQEWFLDTPLMFGLDYSRTAANVGVQDSGGHFLQNFDWVRNQLQFLFGGRPIDGVRLFSYFEFFQDSLLDQSIGSPIQIYSQLQVRLRPTLIIGRSNLTNYLEEGTEFTLAPTTANFFSGPYSYTQLFMSLKKTTIVNKSDNLAFFIGTGIMTNSPVPYQFHLGGYDTIRGFSTTRALGTAYAYGNFEYRPNLFTYKLGWSLIDLVAFQGCIFTDAGWMPGLALLSAGLGIRFIFAKFSGAILRLDWGQTIVPQEGSNISFSLGQFF